MSSRPPWLLRKPRKLRLSDAAWAMVERLAQAQGADESVVVDALLRSMQYQGPEVWLQQQLESDQLAIASWRESRDEPA